MGNIRAVVSGDGRVLETNNYYPYGMQIKPLSQTYYTSSDVKNRYKYNGKEEFTDNGLDWLNYGARMYDAAVGRWWSQDNLSEDPNQLALSPYQYAWDSPVNLNDPDGNCPWCIAALAAGAASAVADYGVQVALNYADNKKDPLTDVNYNSIIISAVAGAATGGVASLERIGMLKTGEAIVSTVTINTVESIETQKVTTGSVDFGQVAVDLFASKISDALPTKPVVETKLLEKSYDRAVRVAGNNPRPSRAAKVAKAQKKLSTANTVNQVASSSKKSYTAKVISTVGAGIIQINETANRPHYIPEPLNMPRDKTRVVQPIK